METQSIAAAKHGPRTAGPRPPSAGGEVFRILLRAAETPARAGGAAVDAPARESFNSHARRAGTDRSPPPDRPEVDQAPPPRRRETPAAGRPGPTPAEDGAEAVLDQEDTGGETAAIAAPPAPAPRNTGEAISGPAFAATLAPGRLGIAIPPTSPGGTATEILAPVQWQPNGSVPSLNPASGAASDSPVAHAVGSPASPGSPGPAHRVLVTLAPVVAPPAANLGGAAAVLAAPEAHGMAGAARTPVPAQAPEPLPKPAAATAQAGNVAADIGVKPAFAPPSSVDGRILAPDPATGMPARPLHGPGQPAPSAAPLPDAASVGLEGSATRMPNSPISHTLRRVAQVPAGERPTGDPAVHGVPAAMTGGQRSAGTRATQVHLAPDTGDGPGRIAITQAGPALDPAAANPAHQQPVQQQSVHQQPASPPTVVASHAFAAGLVPAPADEPTGRFGIGASGLDPASGRAFDPTSEIVRGSAARPVPIDRVAVHIQRLAARGGDRIQIRLHPAELGKVDIGLRIGDDGAVRAVIAVDRMETLELFQRDARGLERALQEAGLKTDSGSLSFHLRGDGQGDAESGEDLHDPSSTEAEPTDAAAENNQPTPPPILSSHAIDIRV